MKKTLVVTSAAFAIVVAAVLGIYALNGASEIICPPPTGSYSQCNSGETSALVALAWGEYTTDLRNHLDVRYYTFRIRNGTPVKGRVTINVDPDNALMAQELHQVMFGGGAQYVYDTKEHRMVDRSYSK